MSGDDWRKNYNAGYNGVGGQGPGYWQGHADRQIKRMREHHQQQAQQQQRWRRAEDERRQRDAAGPARPVAYTDPGPGFYDEHPRARALSNVLAAVFFLAGAAAGVGGGLQAGGGAVVVVVTALICGALFGFVGKILPALVVGLFRLTVGLLILALGLGAIGLVVVAAVYLWKAL